MRMPSAEEGWVLYDGDCAFCIQWLHFRSPVLRRGGFEVVAPDVPGAPRRIQPAGAFNQAVSSVWGNQMGPARQGMAPPYFFFTTGGSSTVSNVISESAEYFR
jgi:hypothetical protein